jgi:hypothetical protein
MINDRCAGSNSLESVFNGRLNPIRSGELITEEVFGANGGDLATKLRYGPHPSASRKLSSCAFDELDVWQAHVRREMNNFAPLHHDQHGVSITHFDFLAHGLTSRLAIYSSTKAEAERKTLNLKL